MDPAAMCIAYIQFKKCSVAPSETFLYVCCRPAMEKQTVKEPFLFKSYDKTIGTAYDVEELKAELERLASADPEAVRYHLAQSHIVQWLSYIGEEELAKKLTGVEDPQEALKIVNTHIENRQAVASPPKKRGSLRRKRS